MIHQPTPNLPDDVVLRVNNVSKKFCRNLRRSMWYGIQDLAGNLLGRRAEGGNGSGRAEGGNLKPENADSSSQSLRSQVSPLIPSSPTSLRSQVSPLIPSSPSSPQLSGFIPHPSSDGLRRDEFWALQNISFDLRRGECLGLIGRNGCGKTTLLRIIAGIFPPDAGEIAIRSRVGALIALGAGHATP